jgi:hypothetical protein
MTVRLGGLARWSAFFRRDDLGSDGWDGVEEGKIACRKIDRRILVADARRAAPEKHVGRSAFHDQRTGGRGEAGPAKTGEIALEFREIPGLPGLNVVV